MKALFKSTYDGLKKHDGYVEVISELNEDLYDRDEVGPMYLCESMGEQFHVFDDELTFEYPINTFIHTDECGVNSIM